MMKLAVLLFALFVCGCQSARILGIFPMPARSHYILGSALMRGLAEKGHDVTVVSPYSEKNPPKKGSYKDVVLTGVVEESERMQKDMNMLDMKKKNVLVLMPIMIKMMLKMSEDVLNHTNVQELLSSDAKFDLVIVEQFVNDAHKAIATHYNAPLVLLSTMGANVWTNMLVGNPAPPSYVPDMLLSYSSHMTFWERLINSLMYVFNQLLYHGYFFSHQGKVLKKYFPDGPEIDDVIYNASIILMNSHPSTNQPVPYVPNMIDIGGFHVQPPKKLPKDLQEFLDGAKDGVIYFSLGSNAKSADLPVEKREALLNTFAKLKEQVLWKWEEDVLPGQPKNVKLGKWLPQQDILAHPNVKLFVTHGGLLSTIETIYHGKPVLAIPIGGDQKLNSQRIVNEGFGLSLPYPEVTEELLTEKINILLGDNKYLKKAKAKSVIFHDRPVAPMDTATYWVEYVLRHGGAPHLRVAALDLPWYKYLLLDVIVFVSVIALLSLHVTCLIIKKIVSCYKQRKQRKQKLKKN